MLALFLLGVLVGAVGMVVVGLVGSVGLRRDLPRG